jgi:hypothetical protein
VRYRAHVISFCPTGGVSGTPQHQSLLALPLVSLIRHAGLAVCVYLHTELSAIPAEAVLVIYSKTTNNLFCFGIWKCLLGGSVWSSVT